MADKFDLRPDIQLNTTVNSARFDEPLQRWFITTNRGDKVSAPILVLAVGTLSAPYKPAIAGIDEFAGALYHTGQWPKQPVDFTGKRVGIIGTGSSGIQCIPIIAEQADHLTVFQRTPQYTIPAGNRPLDPELARYNKENWPEVRERMLHSPFGTPHAIPEKSALDDTPEQRNHLFEKYWQIGGLAIAFNSYNDLLSNEDANHTIAEFVRSKIKQIVNDPDTAQRLLPDYLLGTKRQILDTGYYQTYNRDNVTLVDLRDNPIEKINTGSITTAHGDYPIDVLILATGYDAITGALQRLNPVGRGGISLKEEWKQRFSTYLGMMIPDFPNLFMIHGPESPAVLWNMPFGAELEAEWIRDCVAHMRDQGLETIEPADGMADAWGEEVAEVASHTLFPKTDSWYTGANIPGKHRQFAVHMGGPLYFQKLTEVAAKGYEGFVLKRS